MTVEVTIESAINQLAIDVYQTLDNLEKTLVAHCPNIYLQVFEDAADSIFGKDSLIPAILIKEFGKASYFDLNTITAIEKATSLIFMIAARRFYVLAARNKMKFDEGTLSHKLSRLGYPESTVDQATSQKKY